MCVNIKQTFGAGEQLKNQMSNRIWNEIYTVNSQLPTIQGSRILIHRNNFKKIDHFYEDVQKQICDVHMFTLHAVVLPTAH
jgi:hypothetical protein